MELDLTECRARLAWASQHLLRLKEAVAEYEQSEPYSLRQEFIPTQYMASLYVSSKPLPMEISFMAGDVLHNLRSTLDHLAWQLALSTGARSPSFPLGVDPASKSWRSIFFPLKSKPQSGDVWLPEPLRNLSSEAKAFLHDIQPFVASEDPQLATVWMLQELSNVDKHRVALEAVPLLHMTGTLTTTTPLSRARVHRIEYARVPRMLKQETLLARVWFDTVPLSAPHLDLKHGIWIAFDDALGILPGMPVVGTLENCEAMVETILMRANQLGEVACLRMNTAQAHGG